VKKEWIMINESKIPPALFEETDRRFKIGPSTIAGAGLGLFAAIALTEGERLMIQGIAIKPGSMADQCTAYADLYKIRIGTYLIIPSGFSAMVNHSETDANLDKVHDDSPCGWFVTNRSVEAGEELFFRYHPYALEQFSSTSPG
jgi:hypothetical protein